MTDANDNEINIESPPRVGERLRLAREAKKLTISDIATELRLTKHTIEHIENDQWEQLHGRAYARGYFTNYVKFLDLPEGEFLEGFNIAYDKVEPSQFQTFKQNKSTDNKRTWLSLVVVFILFACLWLGYQRWQLIESDELDETNVTLNDDIEQQSVVIIPTLEDADVLSALDVNSNIDDEFNTEDIENETSTVITEPSDSVSDIEQVVGDEVLMTDENVAMSDKAVKLDFTDECWVEIKDANAKVLLNKIMKKGDSISLTGPVPLSIILGRASAVMVTFNDEIFDTSPYTQRGVAGFTLGEEL